jgi:hypothetical protein
MRRCNDCSEDIKVIAPHITVFAPGIGRQRLRVREMKLIEMDAAVTDIAIQDAVEMRRRREAAIELSPPRIIGPRRRNGVMLRVSPGRLL